MRQSRGEGDQGQLKELHVPGKKKEEEGFARVTCIELRDIRDCDHWPCFGIKWLCVAAHWMQEKGS